MSAQVVLLVVALICWFVAATPFVATSPVKVGWLGMFFYGLSLVVR